MTRRGRPAALPVAKYEPPQRTRVTDTTCVVDFYPEEQGQPLPFDFGRFPVQRDLQLAMAQAFAELTGPSGTLRSFISAERVYAELRRFSQLLATLADPPRCAADITVSHVDRYLLSRRNVHSSGYVSGYTLGVFRQAMMAIKGISEPVCARLMVMHVPSRKAASHASSYTRDEMRRIVQAARKDLQAAADRIRANLDLLSKWRRGEIDRDADKRTWKRGYLLDSLATSDDVPQSATGRRLQAAIVARNGGIHSLQHAIHLSSLEVASAVVLLIALTGVNGGALASTTIAQERADSGVDESALTIIDVVKPRRGRRRRYMSIPLAGIPSWASLQDRAGTPRSGVDDMTTSFGIFTLLLELTTVSRVVSGSQKLFLWCAHGTGTPRVPHRSSIREGLQKLAIPDWGRSAGLFADSIDAMGNPMPLVVTMPRLRLTYVQRHQRPVAHSPRTLADDYLIRDQGAVIEYQHLVAKTLQEQEVRARQNLRLRVLPREKLEQAARDPIATARELGITADVLARILDRSLDTVLAACIDFKHGPFTAEGLPCDASFLMCLSCPRARATPEHLPMLLLARDALEECRLSMTPVAWARLFAAPHAQLNDVIGQFDPTTIEAARSKISESDRSLIQRLFARELDVN